MRVVGRVSEPFPSERRTRPVVHMAEGNGPREEHQRSEPFLQGKACTERRVSFRHQSARFRLFQDTHDRRKCVAGLRRTHPLSRKRRPRLNNHELRP